MPPSNPADARPSRFAGVIETQEDLASLHRHLHEILEGAAFKGSHRSGQFLKYIVEQALAGHFDTLKERIIGVELFERSTTYDTGDDAIVRVTASDVRRRLLQHYGTYKSDTGFRITLPQGTYIPEITRHAAEHKIEHHDVRDPTTPLNAESNAAPSENANAPQDHPEIISAASGRALPAHQVWLAVGILLTALNLAAAGGIFWSHLLHTRNSPRSTPPWSAFFTSSHITQIITSDPNIATIQDHCNHEISVSDYAAHNYLTNLPSLAPDETKACQLLIVGDTASNIDPGITAQIAMLAQRASAHIAVHAARDIELTDLKTDDNFILLGSPRSNPWSALFNDQLDFRFAFDNTLKKEIIHNARPRTGELPQYIPTALGGGTGRSFAILAFVQNLDQNSQVLLLAGAGAEGTEAVGDFATDLPRLSSALQRCGASRSKPPSHFELLLQLDIMAGSPNNISVAACHLLPH